MSRISLSQIGTGSRRCMIGNVEVTLNGNAIEMVALDERNNPKPNSFARVTCTTARVANDRVFTAGVIYAGLVENNREEAAQEAFRAIRGGYDAR